MMANYTFSKFMQAINLLNAGDAAPVREISDQDVPRRFTMSGVAELPFGPGKLVNVTIRCFRASWAAGSSPVSGPIRWASLSDGAT